MDPQLYPQAFTILGELRRGAVLTATLAARVMGIWRLGARVHELRRLGWPVKTRLVVRGAKRYAEYRLDLNARRKALTPRSTG